MQADKFATFAAQAPGVRFVLVNDGSTDQTLAILRGLEAQNPERFSVLDLEKNFGKASAVRAGILRALDEGAGFVGYWDADLSTPLEEIPRFLEVLEQRLERQIVFGARVQLMGRSIRRRVFRHYLGRVAATAISEILRLPIYDTQCGAKLLRVSPQTRSLFAEAFISRWLFDVELLARLIAAGGAEGRARAFDAIYELPLEQWHDTGGSKVRALDFVRAMLDLLRIYRRYLRTAATLPAERNRNRT
jgi:glycosyltransferase involved in cell wall biosynthesis